MSDLAGQILGVVAVIAIFIVIIMSTIYPALKDSGENMEDVIRGTSYGYHFEQSNDTNYI